MLCDILPSLLHTCEWMTALHAFVTTRPSFMTVIHSTLVKKPYVDLAVLQAAAMLFDVRATWAHTRWHVVTWAARG